MNNRINDLKMLTFVLQGKIFFIMVESVYGFNLALVKLYF